MSISSTAPGQRYMLRLLTVVLSAIAAWTAARRKRAERAHLASLSPGLRADIGLDGEQPPATEDAIPLFHPAAVSVQCMAMSQAPARRRRAQQGRHPRSSSGI